MTVLSIVGTILRVIIRILLLPVQMVLTVIIAVGSFAGAVICFIARIIGLICVIGGICGLFIPPIDWELFWQAMIIGSLIGVIPDLIRTVGIRLIGNLKYAISKI